MSLLIVIIAASADLFTAPVPRGRDWIGLDDYPEEALKAEAQGSALVRIVVSNDGKPESCDVIAANGPPAFQPRFGAATCQAVLKRARFKPATDGAGLAIRGVHFAIGNFFLPDDAPPPAIRQSPDLVTKLPADLPSPKGNEVELVVLIEEAGNIESCRSADVKQSAAGTFACEKLKTVWQPQQLRGGDGNPFRYARAARVAFGP